jgi:hypothetical protein
LPLHGTSCPANSSSTRGRDEIQFQGTGASRSRGSASSSPLLTDLGPSVLGERREDGSSSSRSSTSIRSRSRRSFVRSSPRCSLPRRARTERSSIGGPRCSVTAASSACARLWRSPRRSPRTRPHPGVESATAKPARGSIPVDGRSGAGRAFAKGARFSACAQARRRKRCGRGIGIRYVARPMQGSP